MKAYLLPFVLVMLGGWLVAATAFAQPGANPSKTLRSALSWAPGLAWGLLSVFYFLGLDLAGSIPDGIFLAGSFLLCAGLATLPSREFAPAPVGSRPRGPALAARLLFFAALLYGSAAFFIVVTKRPGGGFDAMAIWNYAARFLAHAGTEYRLLIPQLDTAHHMDYPLMLPASVASFWSMAGQDGYEAQHLLQWSFYVGVGLMMREILRAFVSPTRADLGASVLFLVPNFLVWSTQQYADVALAYFLLAGAGGLANRLSRRVTTRPPLLLTGFMFAAAIWTKNEGLPIALLLVALYVPFRWRLGSGLKCAKDLGRLLLGALPVLTALLYFKLGWAPRNDLIVGMEGHASDFFFDAERWRIVKDGFVREMSPLTFTAFRTWSLVWPIAALLVVLGVVKARFRPAPHEVFLLLASLGALVGWFLVYVLTPQDQTWHLETSLSRLLMQILPIIWLAGVVLVSHRRA